MIPNGFDSSSAHSMLAISSYSRELEYIGLIFTKPALDRIGSNISSTHP
jgi:hypothetical protein